uniref:Uncharacterized protein LOC111099667 isoform X3 n=1 Tax=Crassostrea virginica TaxID=6565 RepID=A0A8B8AA60_CRAVI|nr:uncharacterized protein LOC111099667 isoform X3 [Crassostrea virginica]
MSKPGNTHCAPWSHFRSAQIKISRVRKELHSLSDVPPSVLATISMTEDCRKENVSVFSRFYSWWTSLRQHDTTSNTSEESDTIRGNSPHRMQISCQPCLRDTITAEATKCCQTCINLEPLCDYCAQRHALMEANKGHQMTVDLRQFMNSNSKDISQSGNQISCKPCLRDTITAEATKCCQTCKDSEPLCDYCAQRHTLMEAKKGHQMTVDLRQFLNSNSKDISQPRNQISCKPCLRDTITAEATKCCQTCKDPEPLCDYCAQRHALMEANKGHQMTTDLRQFLNSNSNLGFRSHASPAFVIPSQLKRPNVVKPAKIQNHFVIIVHNVIPSWKQTKGIK